MLASEINGKRATVKPSQAKKFAEADEQRRRELAKAESQLAELGLLTPNPNGDAEAFEPAEIDATLVEVVQPGPEAAAGKRNPGGRKNGLGPKTSPKVADTAAGEVVMIPLDKLHQHAANPEPPEAQIVETMGWLQSQRQLEPLIVRPLADPIGHFEVLSGKRRCLAAGRLGWAEIECRVRLDLADDDQMALVVMATANAHRHADTPIRQAVMMKAMIDAGVPVEQAGAVYGLESKSGVTNKLRLLQLPAVWHARLASAEISERAARQLVPYVAAPRVMEAIDKQWKADQEQLWARSRWQKEQDLSHRLAFILREATRPIDKKHKHDFGWELGGEQTRQFELTPAIEAKLDIVELPLGKNGAAKKVATNVAEYDKLQLPLLKAKQKAKEQKRIAGGKPAKTEQNGPLTPAQLKAKRKEADEKTANRVLAWRHRFLRVAASEVIAPGDWRISLLLPWLMQQTRVTPLDGYVHDALVMMNVQGRRGRVWDSSDSRRYHSNLAFADVVTAVDADGDPVRETEETQALLCQWLLWPAIEAPTMKDKIGAVATEGDAAERLPPIEDEDVEAICLFLGVDVKAAWQGLAQSGAHCHFLAEQFFALHTKDQLIDLAEELKLEDAQCQSKTHYVEAFCAQHGHKPLPLPKSIAPLAAAGKTKKGGKRR